MSDYDSMSSEDLFRIYDKKVLTEPTFPPLVEIRVALRRSFIREASNGTCTMSNKRGGDKMTITEARQQLVNVLTPEAAEGRLVLAMAYAMDDLEKATREAGPQVPLENGELPQ